MPSGRTAKWRPKGGGLAPLLLLTALVSCAPSVPREALQTANTAYDAVATASEPLLRDLSAAERRNFLRAKAASDPSKMIRTEEGDIVVPATFERKDAAYYATAGDPILTDATRQGLNTVGAYFKLLTILAEGNNIADAQAQITTIGKSVSGLVALANPAAAAPIGPVIDALQIAVRQWAEAKNAEELRRLVLEGAPKVDALLVGLQSASDSMYETLIAQPSADATGPLLKNKPARRAVILQIRDENVAVANFVQLLQSLRGALAALVDAVRNPGSQMALASLSAKSNDLLVDAKAAMRVAEIIRSGGRSQ